MQKSAASALKKRSMFAATPFVHRWQWHPSAPRHAHSAWTGLPMHEQNLALRSIASRVGAVVDRRERGGACAGLCERAPRRRHLSRRKVSFEPLFARERDS